MARTTDILAYRTRQYGFDLVPERSSEGWYVEVWRNDGFWLGAENVATSEVLPTKEAALAWAKAYRQKGD